MLPARCDDPFALRYRSAGPRASIPQPERGEEWLGSGGEQLAQHEGQDAAVPVVVDLDRRVDAQDQRHALRGAVLPDHERRFLLRPDLAAELDVELLVALDAD